MQYDKKLVRFLLTFCTGWIGSMIINRTELKPKGFMSDTKAYFWFGILTGGIYTAVASIFNLMFDPNKTSNIGYIKVND